MMHLHHAFMISAGVSSAFIGVGLLLVFLKHYAKHCLLLPLFGVQSTARRRDAVAGLRPGCRYHRRHLGREQVAEWEA